MLLLFNFPYNINSIKLLSHIMRHIYIIIIILYSHIPIYIRRVFPIIITIYLLLTTIRLLSTLVMLTLPIVYKVAIPQLLFLIFRIRRLSGILLSVVTGKRFYVL